MAWRLSDFEEKKHWESPDDNDDSFDDDQLLRLGLVSERGTRHSDGIDEEDDEDMPF